MSSSSSNQSTISLNGKPIELSNYSQNLIELKYYPNGISIPGLSTSLYFDKKSLGVQLQGNTSPNPIPDSFVFGSLLSVSYQFNYYDVILPVTTGGPGELLNIINGWLGYVSGITVNGGSTSELLNKINLIEGANIAITSVPDAINNELGITISASTDVQYTAFVASYGNDVTGAIGDISKPYLTLQAALDGLKDLVVNKAVVVALTTDADITITNCDINLGYTYHLTIDYTLQNENPIFFDGGTMTLGNATFIAPYGISVVNSTIILKDDFIYFYCGDFSTAALASINASTIECRNYYNEGTVQSNKLIVKDAYSGSGTTTSTTTYRTVKQGIVVGDVPTWDGNDYVPALPLRYYGAWQDNVTQTAAADNTAYAMIYRTVDLSNGITVVTDGTNLTRITFANTGIYDIQFSVQLQSLSTATEDVTIWLRKNGVDLPATGSIVGMTQRKGVGNPYHTIASWNFVLSVIAGEYYQLMWSTTNHTDIIIRAYTATPPAPAVPSIILTVTQV